MHFQWSQWNFAFTISDQWVSFGPSEIDYKKYNRSCFMGSLTWRGAYSWGANNLIFTFTLSGQKSDTINSVPDNWNEIRKIKPNKNQKKSKSSSDGLRSCQWGHSSRAWCLSCFRRRSKSNPNPKKDGIHKVLVNRLWDICVIFCLKNKNQKKKEVIMPGV